MLLFGKETQQRRNEEVREHEEREKKGIEKANGWVGKRREGWQAGWKVRMLRGCYTAAILYCHLLLISGVFTTSLGRPLPPLVFNRLRRRLWKLLQVAGVFTDGVVVGVVDHPQLPHHLPPNGRFYRPVVHFTVLLLPVQLLHVEDLGGQPVEDDPNVFDAEVVLLVDRELVDQQEELV